MLTMDSKKIILKSLEEIKLMYESAQLVSKTLGLLAKEIKLESQHYTLIK